MEKKNYSFGRFLLTVLFLPILALGGCDAVKRLWGPLAFSSTVLNAPITEETPVKSNKWTEVSSYDDVLGNWSGTKFIPIDLNRFDNGLKGNSSIGARIGFSINQDSFVFVSVIDFNKFLDDGLIAMKKESGISLSKDDVWKVILEQYSAFPNSKGENYKIMITVVDKDGFSAMSPTEKGASIKEMVNDSNQMRVSTDFPFISSLGIGSVEFTLDKHIPQK